MKEHESARPLLWISGTDEHGNSVNPEVIDAAHRIWTRVLHHLRYRRMDVAPAAEILESSCHCVSRAISRNEMGNHIRNVESYLFWAFVRRYRRQISRERRIQYVESIEALVGGDRTWITAFEDEVQFRELVGFLDPRARRMLIRRIAGDSWAEIGESFGVSAHNAEVQFANGVRKARSRVQGCTLHKMEREQN